MSRKFSIVPWNISIWVITLVPFVILIILTYLLLHLPDRMPGILLIVLIILPITMMLFTILSFAPKGYIVSNQEIQIQKLIGKITVPISNIKSITKKDKVAPSLRVMGSGGLGGYYGLFILDKKQVNIYATRLTQVVTIETRSDTYIISPSDPDIFCRAVKELNAFA